MSISNWLVAIGAFAVTTLSLNAQAATLPTSGTFLAFDGEVFTSFESADPPDGGGNLLVRRETVSGLTKFDPTLGTLNKITVNADFDYTITSAVEVRDPINFDESYSASFSILSTNNNQTDSFVTVSYVKGSSTFFMTAESFNPTGSCDSESSPGSCADLEVDIQTIGPLSFDSPVDILNTPPPSNQIDINDFVGVGALTALRVTVLMPEGSLWTTDNVLEAEGYVLAEISAGTVSVEYDYTPTVIPLPAAAWLFGSALIGLGVVKRRKA